MSLFGVTASAEESSPVTQQAEVSELTSKQKSVMKLNNADANDDGTISTEDARLILRAAAGIDIENSTYDVDLDGVTSVQDAVAVLRETTGIEPILCTEEALELFNDRLNSVKEDMPGFKKTTTMLCSSMLITTKGAPLSKLNVTNMEYDKYVGVIVDTMNSPLFSAVMDADMKAQLKAMEQSAVDAYKPKTQIYNADAQDQVAHREFFPIANLSFSSNLTADDVAAVKCTLSGGKLVYTVTMGNYTYKGNAYPTGSTGFSGRLQLPYGKVFNIMAFDESDGSVLNSATYKNGSVVLREDAATGALISVDYNYDYESDITAPKQDDLTMKTVMKTNVKESVVFTAA